MNGLLIPEQAYIYNTHELDLFSTMFSTPYSASVVLSDLKELLSASGCVFHNCR